MTTAYKYTWTTKWGRTKEAYFPTLKDVKDAAYIHLEKGAMPREICKVQNFRLWQHPADIFPCYCRSNIDIERELMRKKRLDRMVRKYINGFKDHVKKNGLQEPGPGDCWGCCMTSDRTSEPFGYDHYLSHFKEKYYVPSLLWNAIVERGYMYPGFIWAFIQKSAEEGREPHHLEHSLRSFFKKRKPFLLEELERMESCVM